MIDQGLAINPKDLTNEELEYVIKTGKIPPKYLSSKSASDSTTDVNINNTD